LRQPTNGGQICQKYSALQKAKSVKIENLKSQIFCGISDSSISEFFLQMLNPLDRGQLHFYFVAPRRKQTTLESKALLIHFQEIEMNKGQLVEKLAEKTALTKTQSEVVLDAALEIIQKTVARGDDVKLVGFGTFSRLNRKSRAGRNPKTGQPVTIPGMKVPRFKPGKDFKDLLN
jgi:DNA-binding protein HU-beta